MVKRDILLSDLSKNEITLANLPPDIIRLLIREEGVKGVDRLRISRTWNAMVQEYLADRSTHPPFDAVRFDNGGPQWHRKDVRVSVRYAKNAFAHIEGAFKRWSFVPENDSIKIIVFYSLIVLGICFFKFRVAFFFLLIAFGIALLWLWLKVGKDVAKNRCGLSRLFSRCATIERLILCELDRATLADVPVNHLILMDQKGDGKLRKQLIKMARTNEIKKISLVVQKFDEKELRKFFLDATQSVDELNVYENTGNTARIFGKHREFWKKKAVEMSDGSFAVEVMNGESMGGMEDKYQWRFKVTY